MFATPTVESTLAASLVPPAQRGRAIALVVGGFSVALILGVPLGTLVGVETGWRTTFVGLALLGVLVLGGCAWLLPHLEASVVKADGADGLTLLRQPTVLLALATTGLVFTGQYVVGTYFAPFLQERTGLDGTGIAAMLFLAGGASALGNALGGCGADRWGIGRTALMACVVLAGALAAVSLLGVSTTGAAVTLGLAGVAIGAFIPAWQYRLVALAPEAPDLALALNLSVLNAGIALGAALGGALVDLGALALLGVPGGMLVLLAVGPLLAGVRVVRQAPQSTPPVRSAERGVSKGPR